MEMGQWVMGQWVTACDPLTHDDEITAQKLAVFLFLIDIERLLTHLNSPIGIAGCCDFLLSRPKDLFSITMPHPSHSHA